MAVAKQRIEKYEPASIEAKWQEEWVRSGLHDTPDDSERPNFYFLTMFPYPSGDIHVGHWYAFAPPDAAARFMRMRGHNVLFPMGFDAFGINAENAAIDRKIHPAVWTEKNMAHMREQFRRMGTAIDWRREVITCYPEYYRWNQWMFLKLYEKGLAYRGEAAVNWCPRDETVLANEQVINGHCERCDTLVVKRQMTQWFYKITRAGPADELDRPLGGRGDRVPGGGPLRRGDPLLHDATRHDLRRDVHGAGARAPAGRDDHDVREASAEREKTGVDTGAFARNVFTGERIPIYVADYVLSTYGTGAIMAVPGHDERDFAFAKKYALEIREVVSPDGAEHARLDEPYIGEGVMVRSGPFTGTRSEVGKQAVAEEARKRGVGKPSVIYRLRDWLISRQRYWGTPIPIVHCETDGAVPVPYDQLPVELPRDVEITGRGGSPLARVASFVNTTCPKCGKPARRDTDTMDTFVDSSWYMYRYVDPKIDTAFMNKAIGRKWLPVQQYTGGVEHAILHLLYMRFMTKALRDLGELPFDEPVIRFRYQGTIVFKGRKMSKSRGNVQTPDDYVGRYGADTLRLFMMFMGPWVDGADWNASGIEGVHRFLWRVWELGLTEREPAGARDGNVDGVVHRTIKKVTEDLGDYHFNTAVAAMMELANTLQHASGTSRNEGVATLILLLAPFAPHITEELWRRRGGAGSIHQQPWPAYDEAVAAPREVTIVVQVDGKVRDRIPMPAGLPDAEVQRKALASPKVEATLNGMKPAKVNVVADRIVSIVTK